MPGPRNRRAARLLARGVTFLQGALLIAGCGSSDAEYLPQTGWWSYFDGGIQQNSCGTSDVYTDPDLTFWLTSHLDGTFTIEQGQNEDFLCTISGVTFSCPQRLSGVTPVQGYDAELHYHVSITGTLQSERSMSGDQHFDVACVGSECGLAPLVGWTLPCTYRVAFTATKQ